MTCKLNLQNKGLYSKISGTYLCLNFSRGLLQIFHIFVCNFSRTFLQTNVQKMYVTLSVFSVESLGVRLQFTIHIFLRTAVLRILFDIRFSSKHCDFSRVCLLVKKASKTVTRSIHYLNTSQKVKEQMFQIKLIQGNFHYMSKNSAFKQFQNNTCQDFVVSECIPSLSNK